MTGVNINRNVVYLTLHELTTYKQNLTLTQRRLLLITFRLMMNRADFMLLNEINNRKGLAVKYYDGMDTTRRKLIDNLSHLQLIELIDKKYQLTQLVNEVLGSEITSIPTHMSWFLSHEQENCDDF